MAVRFAFCPFRLLFKHTFETSHGSRDGTDSLFIRAEEGGQAGYGEVTLPPYLHETIPGAIERLLDWVPAQRGTAEELLGRLEADPTAFQEAPGLRAGLQMALLDVRSRKLQVTVGQIYNIHDIKSPRVMMTLGVTPIPDLKERLLDLPHSTGLKLKVGDAQSLPRVRSVAMLDNRRLLLDGNQGFSTCEAVEELIGSQPRARWIGIEQPFPPELDALNGVLAKRTGVVVIGDESIRTPAELHAKRTHFGGVNVKLMKAGGLDRVASLVEQARHVGKLVMLGSMSESSLGCTAMAHFSAAADVVDLDGPWLIKNDPFEGIRMTTEGGLRMPTGSGIGASLTADLSFNPIGA